MKIWIAWAPAGVASSGPAVCSSEVSAEEYDRMGWDVEGPFALVANITSWLRNEVDSHRGPFWADVVEEQFGAKPQPEKAA